MREGFKYLNSPGLDWRSIVGLAGGEMRERWS